MMIKKMFDEKFNMEDMKEEILLKEKPRNFKYYLVPVCLVLIISFIFVNYNSLKYHVLVNDIYINYIDVQTESSLSSMDIDGKSYDVDMDEVYSLCFGIKDIVVPDGLINVKNIKMYSRKSILDDDYSVFDGYNIMYSDDDKYMEIFISETLKQKRRDFLFDDLKDSLINGVYVTIVSYGNRFIVNFKYDNLFFDIESINVSQDELITLLESLIK